MTTPSDIPPVPTLPAHPAQQEAEKVAKVAGRIVKARNYLSNTLKVTVPAAATGAVVGILASRRTRSENKDVSETVTAVDYDNE